MSGLAEDKDLFSIGEDSVRKPANLSVYRIEPRVILVPGEAIKLPD